MKYLIRALCVFLVLWSGLAAYPDLIPLTKDGLAALLGPFPVVVLIGYLRDDTVLSYTAAFTSGPIALAYLWMAFSPLVPLTVILMIASYVWMSVRE